MNKDLLCNDQSNFSNQTDKLSWKYISCLLSTYQPSINSLTIFQFLYAHPKGDRLRTWLYFQHIHTNLSYFGFFQWTASTWISIGNIATNTEYAPYFRRVDAVSFVSICGVHTSRVYTFVDGCVLVSVDIASIPRETRILTTLQILWRSRWQGSID